MPQEEAELRRWADDIVTGVLAWRQAHPRATFAEIEAALDNDLDPLRARLLAATLPQSASADLTTMPVRPVCPDCGVAVQAQGQEERTVHTRGGHPIRLRRSAARCPACGRRVFPPG